MPMGGGKYNDETTAVREKTGGGVLLAVFDGKKGSGFEVQADLMTTARLPQILRQMANEIEASMRRGQI